MSLPFNLCPLERAYWNRARFNDAVIRQPPRDGGAAGVPTAVSRLSAPHPARATLSLYRLPPADDDGSVPILGWVTSGALVRGGGGGGGARRPNPGPVISPVCGVTCVALFSVQYRLASDRYAASAAAAAGPPIRTLPAVARLVADCLRPCHQRRGGPATHRATAARSAWFTALQRSRPLSVDLPLTATRAGP